MSWTPARHELHSDPAVLWIATKLSITEDEVVGRLFRIWFWFDAHSLDGSAVLPDGYLGRLCGNSDLPAAMMDPDVAWLRRDGNRYTIPNFKHWMGKGAKKRLLDARRKSDDRATAGPENGISENEADICPSGNGHESGQMSASMSHENRTSNRTTGQDIELEKTDRPAGANAGKTGSDGAERIIKALGLTPERAASERRSIGAVCRKIATYPPKQASGVLAEAVDMAGKKGRAKGLANPVAAWQAAMKDVFATCDEHAARRNGTP